MSLEPLIWTQYQEPNLLIPGRRPVGPVRGIGDGAQLLFNGPAFVDNKNPPIALQANAEWVKDGASITGNAGWVGRTTLTSQEVTAFSGPLTILMCLTPRSWGHYGDFGRIIQVSGDNYAIEVFYRSGSSGIRCRVGTGNDVIEFAPTNFNITDTHTWSFVSYGVAGNTNSTIYFGNPGTGFADKIDDSRSLSAAGSLDLTDDFVLGNRSEAKDRAFDGTFHHFMIVPYVMPEAEIRAYLADPYQFLQPANDAPFLIQEAAPPLTQNIQLGANSIDNAALGADAVDRIYRGSSLAWER